MAINENIPFTYEIRDMVKIHCNYKDVLWTIIRCNSKSNVFVPVWFSFVICFCVPCKLIHILSYDAGFASCRAKNALMKFPSAWTKLTAPGALVEILVFSSVFRQWLSHSFSISDSALFFPCTLYSKPHFPPMFLLIRKRKKLNFWNKQFLYRESQGCTHIKAK